MLSADAAHPADFVDLFLCSPVRESQWTACFLRRCTMLIEAASLTLTPAEDGAPSRWLCLPWIPLQRQAPKAVGAGGRRPFVRWSASFTSVDGNSETARIDVDSDPLYGPFVDKVAEQLEGGFVELPRIRDLEATMTVIWDAYAHGRQGRTGVDTQHR